jgi:outer membrane assembly lipoprotein YfiO
MADVIAGGRMKYGWLAIGLLLATVACGSKQEIPTGVTEADKFLFEKGTEALNKKRWFSARQYFTRLVDNYPQSPHRPHAKLGIGDSYLGEGTTETLAQATSEFKEFLNYFPTHKRADYAQYKLGYVHYARMRGPARDQTETRAAIAEWERFVERYPNSELMPEVRAKATAFRRRSITSACSTTREGGIRPRSIDSRICWRRIPCTHSAMRCTTTSASRW